jgi:hypothetical protein
MWIKLAGATRTSSLDANTRDVIRDSRSGQPDLGIHRRKIREKRSMRASFLSSPARPVTQEARHLWGEIDLSLLNAWQRHDLKRLRMRHSTAAAFVES